jgi:hypothetical protein
MKPLLGWFSFISILFCEFSAFLVYQGKLEEKRGARQKREIERERGDDDEVFFSLSLSLSLFFFLS